MDSVQPLEMIIRRFHYLTARERIENSDFFLKNYFIYMYNLPSYKSVYHVVVWNVCMAGKGNRSLGSRVTDGCELSYEF